MSVVIDPDSYLCVLCRDYLLENPRQAPCGDRICDNCWRERKRDGKELTCPACQQTITLDECFKDKALQQELAKITLKCKNEGCPWEGLPENYKAHTGTCRYTQLKCANVGCEQMVMRGNMEQHSQTCTFSPTTCSWCSHTFPKHELEVCSEVMVHCPDGCGQKLLRRNLGYHLQVECPYHERPCAYREFGCTKKGNFQSLAAHEASGVAMHLALVKKALDKCQAQLVKAVEEKVRILELETARQKEEVEQVKEAMSSKLQSVVEEMMKTESAVKQLQEGFTEMALLMQTLQATSYNGVFIWKIPEVRRRRQEAKLARTISLYSAPFYTSRHGYKLCLRLYMDGDGSGKGTHLSFFLTIMRGEFDALLPWPFKQTVSLILLDQDKQRDIIQSFRPEPTSASFQRPHLEMNVASGCPMFAPLSVLENPSYVKDDVMFLKCLINTSGL